MGIIYKALWGAIDAQGVVQVEHTAEITAEDYGPVPGEPLAIRVDIPQNRVKLPKLQIGEVKWQLLGAAEGLDETERTARGFVLPFDLSLGRGLSTRS